MAVTKYLAKAMLGREELNYGVQFKSTWRDSRGGEDKCGIGRGLPIRWDWDSLQGVNGEAVRKLLFDDESSVLFVTCRHVVDLPYADRDRVGSKLQNVTIRWGAGKRRAEYDPGRDGFRVFVPRNNKLDLALVRIGEVGEVRGDLPRPPLLCIKFTELFQHHLSLCSDLDWGARVGFVSQQPWTGDLPILRTGVVASDPQTTFNAGLHVGRDEVLLLEAQSFSGSSGSPVWAYPIGNPIHSDFSHSIYELEQYRPPHLVGIMSGHLRNDRSDAGMLSQQHVGLSYCHKLEVLCKLLIGQEGLIELRPW